MDERVNLTLRQLRLIQKMNRYNECRISHVAAHKLVLVVRDQERQEYLVFKIARRGMADLLSAYQESDSALKMFQQTLSVSNYRTFLDLVRLAQADKTITRADMVHFSSEELISLFTLAVDELVRRVGVEVFVKGKVMNGKELLEASSERTVEALRAEFAKALEELRSAREEDDPDSNLAVDIHDEQSAVPETDDIADFDLEDCF